MSLEQQVADYFSPEGMLSKHLPNFNIRQAQIEMAQKIAKIIDQEETLVAEAGTGTGKTFAYLIPALLSGKTIMISTATKTLQQQLISKDLPPLLEAFNMQNQAAILKGRENYLCAERLEITETQSQNSKVAWKKLADIRSWSEESLTGDLSEAGVLNETDPMWRKVNARLEYCQAVGCSKDSECFYQKAKQRATEAKVLVVNHHLFCADLALREKGFSELLPEADIYVFDEAHKLPDIAAQFLGFNISRSQLEDLLREIKLAQKEDSPESVDLSERADAIFAQIVKVNNALGVWDKRWNWDELFANKAFIAELQALINHFTVIADHLKSLEKRGKLLAAANKKTEEIIKQLETWLETEVATEIRWAEASQARFRLNLTPLNIAKQFSYHRAAIGGSWIFTSATLSVGKKFDYFCSRLGLSKAQTALWESPFDFDSQGVIYHPVGLPQPRDKNYITICLRAMWPLLKASKGRAFLLFTSYRAMLEAKDILSKHWDGKLWVQGDADKLELLEKFQTNERSILLGTSSFWEGVDIQGQDLQLVMIDRIPFVAPDDPLVQARESYLKEQGLNVFAHFQLPEATMSLKQGVGRLIRDRSDKGVLVLCDPRLTTKNYGRTIINSLPSFPWVYQPEKALTILEEN